MAATFARSAVVAYGRDGDALPDPHADHFFLTEEQVGPRLGNFICQLAARHGEAYTLVRIACTFDRF